MDQQTMSAHKSQLKSPALSLLAALFALLLPAQPASAQEARCTELGTSCFCSEPLNVPVEDQGIIGDVDDDGGPDLNYDPSDSVTKECHSSGASVRFATGGEGEMISAAAVGLPAGHSVTSVLEIVARQGGAIRSDDSSTHQVVDFTDKTYCVRVYFREDPGMPSAPGGTDDIKGVEISQEDDIIAFDEDGTYQCFTPKKDAGFTHTLTDFAGTGDVMDINDCSDVGWCSIEICQDHNWDPGTPDNLNVRCRLRALGNNKQRDYTSVSTNTGTLAEMVGRHLLWRFLTDRVDSQDIGKWRRSSHIMTALLPEADETFWIGPASEIEGGAPPSPSAAGVVLSGGVSIQ